MDCVVHGVAKSQTQLNDLHLENYCARFSVPHKLWTWVCALKVHGDRCAHVQGPWLGRPRSLELECIVNSPPCTPGRLLPGVENALGWEGILGKLESLKKSSYCTFTQECLHRTCQASPESLHLLDSQGGGAGEQGKCPRSPQGVQGVGAGC